MISLLLYFCVAIVLLFYFDDANVSLSSYIYKKKKYYRLNINII
nr:MAG TPA: Protein of unknown function (DUF1378) [Caudoviricetes sp.]